VLREISLGYRRAPRRLSEKRQLSDFASPRESRQPRNRQSQTGYKRGANAPNLYFDS
jgi:hypothetical protein